MAAAKKLYRILLKLYPARFREEYEKPLERQFLDEYGELQGALPKALFWMRALADLAISIPVEISHELRQDMAYSVRVYRHRSVSVGMALVALALTIGVTTGVFGVMNALLFRSLPFREPDRLVQFKVLVNGSADGGAYFRQWSTSRAFISDAAGYRTSNMTFRTTGDARRLKVAETSANFFALMGSDPLVGRAFAAGEDKHGSDSVAVISYGLWQQLGGDPRMLGSTIHLNGAPLTVVGIAARGFDYPGKTAVWVPTVYDTGFLYRERAASWTVIGRLRGRISLGEANRQYRKEEIELYRQNNLKLDADDLADIQMSSLRDQLTGEVRKTSFVLFGVVLFVLLTACANVAHLLLSRLTERRKEMMLRAALGASRARLLQQLITETTVLTVSAAAAGLLVANWVARLASSVQPPSLTTQTYTILDWPVLLFAAGIAVLTGLVFGVLPAALIGRLQPSMDPLRQMGGGHTTGVQRLRTALVGLQAAFTVVLLAGAFTLGRSFLKLAGEDLGLRTDHVVTMNVALSGTPREKNSPAYLRDVLERLRAVPGVESAGAVEHMPLTPYNLALFPFQMGDSPARMGVPVITTTDYLRTMGTPLLAGRDFTATEEAQAMPVAIVNQEFARQFDPGLHVVGKQLTSAIGKPLTIVGIVRNQIYFPHGEVMPLVYTVAGWTPVRNMALVAHVHGDAGLYKTICRDAVRGVDPEVPVFNVTTLDERLRDSLARPRFYTTAILFLGGFALLMAVIGIYGVASFSVTQRKHEIGVRLAVGAHPQRLRGMLLREGMLPVAGGLAVGIAAASASGKVLQHLMDGADPVGFAFCAAAGAVLVAAAGLAVWSATRRILRMDPMRVLRAE